MKFLTSNRQTKVGSRKKLCKGNKLNYSLSSIRQAQDKFRPAGEKSLRSLNNPEGDGREGYLFVNAPRLRPRQVAFKDRFQGFLAFGFEMTG
jgi:hypothetical protein